MQLMQTKRFGRCIFLAFPVMANQKISWLWHICKTAETPSLISLSLPCDDDIWCWFISRSIKWAWQSHKPEKRGTLKGGFLWIFLPPRFNQIKRTQNMVWQVKMAFFWQISDTEWERLFGQRESSADFAKTPASISFNHATSLNQSHQNHSLHIIQPCYKFEMIPQKPTKKKHFLYIQPC